MYLEGGPEASLYFSADGIELERIGHPAIPTDGVLLAVLNFIKGSVTQWKGNKSLDQLNYFWVF